MLVDLARIEAGDRVLDLGCGRGASLEALLERVGPDGEVFALDRRKQPLDEAAARHCAALEGASLVIACADLRMPPFRDGVFDAIMILTASSSPATTAY